MNYKTYLNKILILSAVLLLSTGCFKDLETVPIDPDEQTPNIVYEDFDSYKQILAKIYAGLALSGQQGPAGQPDIVGIDEGFSTYMRQYFKAQELTTDEAVIAWNDGNLYDYHDQDWDANNEFVAAMYNRIFYQVSLINEFLRQSSDDLLNQRGFTDSQNAEIAGYRAEARFMRALSYYHGLDFFRSIPFVTEDDPVGAFLPEQTSATDLFNFIESELLAVEGELMEPGANEYGRADKGAAWMLLSKLYLNADTYIGTDRNSDCITYCDKVINSVYSLDEQYDHIFLADNHLSPEIIFPVIFDGVHSQTWGGMTFIINGSIGGGMNPGDYGSNQNWGGMRTTSKLVQKFTDIQGDPIFILEPNAAQTFPQLQVPGGYQGWDPANETTVIGSINSDGVYEGYLNLENDNTELKFTDGPAWDVNWGDNGADGTLEPGGSNIVVPEAGYHRFLVDINALSYTITKTNWGLVGSATPGGWDTDTDMTYNSDNNTWEITLNLVPGEIKFRANDEWEINYGDDNADGSLESGGANIAISDAAEYTIVLYLNQTNFTYSIKRPSTDKRGMFFTDGQTLEIDDISQFAQGYAVTKYKNLTQDGQPGSDLTFPDTDFPLFRLADAYLMYAEAVVRGGSGGSAGQATDYINELRNRAFAGVGGTISEGELNLDLILDERARELYWEGHRRTDLVRFGKFSNTTDVWPWKGKVKEGIPTSEHLDIFPIPAADISANPNLKQNDGY